MRRKAQPPYLPILQHPQELGLEVHRHLGDLVEQHRALVGLLQEAGFVGGGAGEGALHMPEELGLDQVLGERRAVDLHVGPARARALGVQRVGRQLLAGAALAHDEHVGVRPGHRLQKIEHPAHRRRAAQQLAETRLLGQAPLEIGGLRQEAPPLQCLAHQGEHLGGVERFGDEVEGALLGGLHRLGDGGVARHDDHFERRILALELLQELEAVAIGQDQVHQGESEFPLGHLAEGRDAVPGHPDVIALTFEDDSEPVGDRGLVVYKEDARLHGFSHLLFSLAWRKPLCHQGDTQHLIEPLQFS